MNATTMPSPKPGNGRRMLALIAGLMALPFVLATLLWQFGWQPDRQVNHGELLASAQLPVLEIKESDLFYWDSQHLQKNSANATLAESEPALLGHWLLAVAAPAECANDCVAQLQLARQVQVTLNKQMSRLHRALIGPALNDTTSLKALNARWPDLKIAHSNHRAWQTLGGNAITTPQLFLIDPNGVLVLRYPAQPDPQGVRKDIERLLKYSWLG